MQGSSGVGVHFRVGLGRSNHREVFGLLGFIASSTVHVTCTESPAVQLPDTSVVDSGRSHALFLRHSANIREGNTPFDHA